MNSGENLKLHAIHMATVRPDPRAEPPQLTLDQFRDYAASLGITWAKDKEPGTEELDAAGWRRVVIVRYEPKPGEVE